MRQTLVYLPGLDGTGRLLHRQPRLHDQYDVRCISYPHDRPTTYDDLADLGIAALEAGADRPGIVLAESFGGAVALTLALRRPDLVERLALVNTFAYFPRRYISIAAWLGRYLPAKPSHPASRRFRGWFFFPPEISADEQNEWWDRTADVPMSAFGTRFAMIAGLDLRPRLAEVAVPAVVFVASNDRVVPPSAGRCLARDLPRAKLIEMPVGHGALIHPRVDVASWL